MSADYYKARALILKDDSRGYSWKKRALQRLERELGAEVVHRREKKVALETESGRVLCRKKGFKSREAAEGALEQIQLYETVAVKTPQRVYHCAHCQRFHLTSASYKP